MQYATADGTATTADNDYVSASGTLTILAGNTTGTITIHVNGDTTFEADETFFVNLSNATNATITDNQGIGTLTNDDGAPSLSINDLFFSEPSSGTGSAVFTVSLSHVAGQSVTVDYATANGTAIAGSDYQSASGVLTFNPDETTKNVTITIQSDALDEGRSHRWPRA